MVKVGSLGDQSGLYADIGGPGSSSAANGDRRFGLKAKGWKIELSGRPSEQARRRRHIGKQWIDVEKVDVFVDLATSGVGLAIANLAKDKNVVNLNSDSASSDLTGAQCWRTPCIGSTTPGCSPTARARRWPSPAATAGSS